METVPCLVILRKTNFFAKLLFCSISGLESFGAIDLSPRYDSRVWKICFRRAIILSLFFMQREHNGGLHTTFSRLWHEIIFTTGEPGIRSIKSEIFNQSNSNWQTTKYKLLITTENCSIAPPLLIEACFLWNYNWVRLLFVYIRESIP